MSAKPQLRLVHEYSEDWNPLKGIRKVSRIIYRRPDYVQSISKQDWNLMMHKIIRRRQRGTII